MKAPSDGGKASPRLFFDFLRYFPHLEPVNENRVIQSWASLPPHLKSPSGAPARDDIPVESETVSSVNQKPSTSTPVVPTRHTFFLKQGQTALPESAVSDVHPFSKFRAATICNSTRFHFDFEIDFSSHKDNTPIVPCGTIEGAPTHHLVHTSSDVLSGSSPLPSGSIPDTGIQGRWMASHIFQCSKDQCAARMRVLIREPVISHQTLQHLVDPVKMKARYEAAVTAGIENAASLAPINILRNLLVYINNSLKDDFDIKSFAYLNRVFYPMFGTDCVPFLEYIGFERLQDPETGHYICWNTPRPDGDKDKWRWPDQRTLLEDIREELVCLISQRPMVEYSNTPNFFHNLSIQTYAAGKVLADFFGCSSYSAKSTFLWDDSSPSAAYAYPYDVLGILPDFEDDWISYVFDCQCQSSPDRIPKFLDALQIIAEQRSSESLFTKAALVMSQGYSTLRDIDAAYTALQLPLNTDLTDDDILAAFSAASFEASAPRDMELRENLREIGNHRSSQTLIAESIRVQSYEQALIILGVEFDASDDVIISTAVAKKLEYAESDKPGWMTSQVMEALRVVAASRESTQIKNWLENLDGSDDELDHREMNVSQAYDSFNISDMNSYVDPETLELTKENFIADRPEDFARISTAYEKIMAHNRDLFPDGPPPQVEPEFPFDVASWPVGLDNIGNTCYLNSILQYLFTIKGLRELVLKYDQDQLKASPETLANRRVGGRLLSLKEVARAQRFVQQLRRLFEQMVSSPFPVIQPERELAVLTLMRPDSDDVPHEWPQAVYEHIDTPKDDITPSSKHTIHIGRDDDTGENKTFATGNSDTSDTLVDDFQYPPTVRIKRQKTEEMADPPENPQVATDHPLESIVLTTPPVIVSPSDSTHAQFDEQDAGNISDIEGIRVKSLQSSPSLPSLVHESTRGTHDTSPIQSDSFTMAEYAAQQQDVTEVMKNVLFQLEAAIPGGSETYDENGEQNDLIKELFFMKVLWSRPDGTTKEEVWNDVIVYLPSGPRTLYSALDAEFDPHTVDLGNDAVERYGSLKTPPLFFQVNVSRVDFDPVRNVAFKVEHHLELMETIYLDRYLHSDDPKVLERRRRRWKLNAELEHLKTKLKDVMDLHARSRFRLRSTLGKESGGADGPDPVSDEVADDEIRQSTEPVDDDDVRPSVEVDEPPVERSGSSSGVENEPLGEPLLSRELSLVKSESPKPVEPVADSTTPSTEESIEGPEHPLADTSSTPSQADAMEIDPVDRTTELAKQADEIQMSILQKEDELSHLFDDMQTEPYHLFAQFMHKGLSSGGHYWINIRDLETGMWRQYNDSSVSELKDWEEAVFKQAPMWPATPYFLVYVRGNVPGGPTSLANTVCRNVVAPVSDFSARPGPRPIGYSIPNNWSGRQQDTHPVSPVSVLLSDSGMDSDAMQLSPSVGSSAGTLDTDVDLIKIHDRTCPDPDPILQTSDVEGQEFDIVNQGSFGSVETRHESDDVLSEHSTASAPVLDTGKISPPSSPLPRGPSDQISNGQQKTDQKTSDDSPLDGEPVMIGSHTSAELPVHSQSSGSTDDSGFEDM